MNSHGESSTVDPANQKPNRDEASKENFSPPFCGFSCIKRHENWTVIPFNIVWIQLLPSLPAPLLLLRTPSRTGRRRAFVHFNSFQRNRREERRRGRGGGGRGGTVAQALIGQRFPVPDEFFSINTLLIVHSKWWRKRRQRKKKRTWDF